MKKRYIVPSAVMFAVSVFGGVAFGAQNTYAEELPNCVARKYIPMAGDNQYAEVTSPISLTEDTIASFVVPDQDTRCKFEINLNGKKLSGAATSNGSDENVRPAIEIGNNVEAVLEGNNGSIEYIEPSNSTTVFELASQVVVKSGGSLTINNVSSIVPESDSHFSGYAIENKGNVVINNLSTESNIWNEGDITINDGTYGGRLLTAGSNAHAVVNGGSWGSFAAQAGSKLDIRNANVNDAVVVNRIHYCETNTTLGCPANLEFDEATNSPYDPDIAMTDNITIYDGTYNNVRFIGKVNIKNGTFTNPEFENGAIIENGTFNSPIINDIAEISNGVFKNATIEKDTSSSSYGSAANPSKISRVTVSGGTFDQTAVLPGGTLNVSGGQLTNTMVASGAIMNTTGGTLNIVGVFDDGTLNVNGGIFKGVQAYGGTYGIIVDEDGVVNISNGAVTTIDVIDGTVNITGGRVEKINAEDDGEVNITGGRIGALNVPNSNLNIYGGTFSAAPESDTMPDDAVVTQNSNGTYTVTSSASTNHPEDSVDDAPNDVPDDDDDDTVGAPDTGAMFQFETSGKIALSIAAVLAGIVVFAKLGGYAHERARAKRVIDFDK